MAQLRSCLVIQLVRAGSLGEKMSKEEKVRWEYGEGGLARPLWVGMSSN